MPEVYVFEGRIEKATSKGYTKIYIKGKESKLLEKHIGKTVKGIIVVYEDERSTQNTGD